MKNKIVVLALLLNSILSAQSMNIESQNSFGGNNTDFPIKVVKLDNGKRILLASSKSTISWDKTENCRGDFDIWVICLDENEQIIWQKTIGGNNIDLASDVIVTSDQFIFICGSTLSPMSFEQSNTLYGSWDAWLIKLDSLGNILFDKNFGGTEMDGFTNIIEIESGNLLAFGSSMSGISGNKTSLNHGQSDVWAVKLDIYGNKILDNSIGGSGIDNRPHLVNMGLNKIILVSDSDSPISGNKTESCFGNSDLWILEIDTNFQIIQQKTIGGDDQDNIEDCINSNFGGYLIISSTLSGISGVKNEVSFGGFDTWILRLNDDFSIADQISVGSTDSEYAKSIVETASNNLSILCESYSPPNIFKSEPNLGLADIWIYHLNQNLDFLSDKTFGTSQNDFASDLYLSNVNEQVSIWGQSNGGIENDKTSINKGEADIWCLKLSPIQGLVSNDAALKIILFPIPFSSTINIKGYEGGFILYNATGQRLIEGEINMNNEKLDLGYLENGQYFIELIDVGRIKKIIKAE